MYMEEKENLQKAEEKAQADANGPRILASRSAP